MNIRELINRRRLINGPTDRLMCINPLKHKWAMDVLRQMQKNDWYPQSIPMGDDVLCFKERLDDAERSMYVKALAFLSNLDGIQFNNLITNIGAHVTSPEVSMMLSRQAYEEANHVMAYSIMIESMALDPLSIYGLYETDEILAAKNKFIMAQSDALNDGYTDEKFALAVVGNIALEGIYFFSGFLSFYVLAKNGKMLKSADQIKYIQRDEETHLDGFVGMYHTLQVENPEIFTTSFYDKAQNLIRASVDLEVAWGKHIISGGVLGLTDTIVDNRIKYLANVRAEKLGWNPLYPGVKNPTPWVEEFSAVNGVNVNFFEGKPTDYQSGGALDLDF